MKCLVSAQGVNSLDLSRLAGLMRNVDMGSYVDEHTMRDETPEISPNDAVPCCSGF